MPSAPPQPAPLPEGERRQATVVFSDLSGYTSMNERLDPEEVEAIMSRIKKEAVRIEAWVNDAVKAGAKLLAGGQRSGAIYDPTVLGDVPEGARVGCEEVFAPVVSIYPVAGLEEAAAKGEPTMPALLACARARATLGEMSRAVEGAFGRYRPAASLW